MVTLVEYLFRLLVVGTNITMEGIGHMEKRKLGLILWKLQKLEDFFPCFKSMIKK